MTAPEPECYHQWAPTQGASFGRSIVEGWTFSWRTEEVRAGLLMLWGVTVYGLSIVAFAASPM